MQERDAGRDQAGAGQGKGPGQEKRLSRIGEDHAIRSAKAACAALTSDDRFDARDFARLVALATADPEFRGTLLRAPMEALAEKGVAVPDGVEVRFHESTESEINIALPPLITPAYLAAEAEGGKIQISDDDLESGPGEDFLLKDDFDVGDMTGIFGWDSDRSDPDVRD